MLFNSLEFLVFLPVVFGLYWGVPRRHLRAQNLLLLVASYLFYGWWDWRFLGLIALSTLVDFVVGIRIEEAEERPRKKRWLWVSLAVNLGILGYFKYAGFFVDSWVAAWRTLGVTLDARTTSIVLPVGISFYTFQTLSYSLDIHRGKLKATRDPIAFAAFVAFFPQLVAGPIERAVTFLPQIASPRTFAQKQGREGLRLILWGLFKKVAVSGACAPYVDACFAHPEATPGSTLVLGSVLFVVQIYADFSGYSDIAIGTAKLLGFELMTNFKFPLFARNFAEFWRNWHVSLNSWLIDYLFVPLARLWRKRGKTGITAAVLTTFGLSGLWHGADATFVLWGLVCGALFLPFALNAAWRKTGDAVIAEGGWLPPPMDVAKVLFTILIISLACVLFRAPDWTTAVAYYQHIPQGLLSWPRLPALRTGLFLGVLFAMEYLNREHPRRPLHLPWTPLRWASYLMLLLMVAHSFEEEQAFIYFQF